MIYQNERSFLESLPKGSHWENEVYAKIKQQGMRVALFGAGAVGLVTRTSLLENGITPSCFIDDNEEKQKKGYIGLPVLSLSQFLNDYDDKTCIIVSIANNARHVMDTLIRRGLPNPIYYIGVRDPWSEVTTFGYIEDHIHDFFWTYQALEDNISKELFQSLLQHKITGQTAVSCSSPQYFEIVSLDSEDSFLDVGACGGETSVQFHHETGGKYRKITALEPDSRNRERLHSLWESNGVIGDVIPMAAWHEQTTLSFASDLDEVSNVMEPQAVNTVQISADTIDHMTKGEPVTFIKMDIEGAEMNALLGAKKTIQQYKPKLAISVYHKREDLFDIPRLIRDFCPSYKLYLRNYTETAADTVLYAL